MPENQIRQQLANGALRNPVLYTTCSCLWKPWNATRTGPRLAQYASTLFERARDLPSCVLLARSLFETGKFAALVEHVRNHADLLSASASLQSLLAWALYNLGNMRECRKVLGVLRDKRDAREDRDPHNRRCDCGWGLAFPFCVYRSTSGSGGRNGAPRNFSVPHRSRNSCDCPARGP